MHLVVLRKVLRPVVPISLLPGLSLSHSPMAVKDQPEPAAREPVNGELLTLFRSSSLCVACRSHLVLFLFFSRSLSWARACRRES